MRARSNLIASYIFIVLNIIINLLVVRFTVHEYGEKLYAIIVLAYSFVTYVESFNLGVYISNRTQIPLRHKHAGAALAISSFKYLFNLSAGLILLSSILFYFFGDIFLSAITTETDPSILSTGKQLIFVAIIYGLIKIPLSLVLSAFAGHDLVDVEKKYNGLQQIAKFLALWIAIKLKLGIFWYFSVFAASGIGILLWANIHFYRQFLSTERTRLLRYSKRISPTYITFRSFKFFVFTLASVVVWSTDNLIVSIFFDPSLVANYQINFSIFNAAFLFITAISGAAVASFGNFIKDQRYEELDDKVNFSLYSSIHLAFGILVGSVLFSREIIDLWVGEGHFVGYSLIIAFSVFGLTVGISSVLNTLLAMFARSRVIIAMAVGEGILNILFSILLLKVVGVVGVAIGTTLASIVAVLIPGLYMLKKHFGKNLRIEVASYSFPILVLIGFVALGLNIQNQGLGMKTVVFLTYSAFALGYTYYKKRNYFYNLVRFKA
jgi:O-antigen/teichoic acid export membrane protein